MEKTTQVGERPAPIALFNIRALALPLLTAVGMALGFALRLRPVASADFPLNDGGMFYVAIQEIQRAHYHLPLELSYNGGIPFVYPPLAFYLATAVADLGGIGVTDVLRILPLLFNALGVVAFIPLARGLLHSERSRTISLFAFALIPAGFVWLIMGGGLTRSLGFLCAIVTLASLRSFFAVPRFAVGAVAAAFSALTLLSHIEMAWFLAFSAALLLVPHRRSRSAVRGAFAIAGAALVLASPWWVLVLARHGPGPFLAAATTGSLSNPVEQLLRFRETAEPHFPLFAALALVGVVVCLARRDYLLPGWLVATGLLDARSFGAVSTVPMALLVAVGVTGAIAPLERDRRSLAVLAAAAIAYAAAGAVGAEPELLRALTPSQRAAMSWAAENTPEDSRFVVVSEQSWASDRDGEWLPALTRRRSVATVQGTEWLPARAFWKQLDRFDRAQECGSAGVDCLEQWSRDGGTPFDYVFLPKTKFGERADGSAVWCCASLRAGLAADPRYDLVYDGAGASIFARRP
ncbi:MAG: hypothetical protein M3O91_01695 [Chloroflexota bacterium]|nr:hypothetical protein [Chloroflexota bacterium]